MQATNYSELRKNMRIAFASVNDDYEPLFVSRPNKKNVIVISEEMYNSMIETLYLMEEKENYDWIKKSIQHAEEIDYTERELIDE